MEKLKIFICENFYPEYKNVLQSEGFEDVEICSFYSLCTFKGKKAEVKKILARAQENHSILICSKYCEALKLLPDGRNVRIEKGEYCFSHLTCNEFINYLILQGSYIISSGWLKNWKSNISDMGFDEETGRRFFQESNKQLVLLDSKTDDNSELYLKEFSSFAGLPYLIVPVELEGFSLMLKSFVFEWRLHMESLRNSNIISGLRSQCAEYSAVFDILSKISTHTTKRDVINKVKEIFIIIFGARNFKFWSDKTENIPEEITDFISQERIFILLKEENRFCIKVLRDDTNYGVIDVSGFLFPQYIENYLNLALQIAKFTALVLQNTAQYEKIIESEKELKYLSFHDSSTGLYNRTYINRILADSSKNKNLVDFVFDIDKLKYVNDNYGHAEGDKLISGFAEIMKVCFRENDIIARIGGDEFIAILYDSDEEIAISIKQRIIKSIAKKNKTLNNLRLALSVSIGYAIQEQENETLEALMKKADALMYEDKVKMRL